MSLLDKIFPFLGKPALVGAELQAEPLPPLPMARSGGAAGQGMARSAKGGAGPEAAASAGAARVPPQPQVRSEFMTVAQRRRMAARPPSFTDMLPWRHYDAEHQVFELIDGQTLGLLFELMPVATEARPDHFLRNTAYRIQEALQAIPEAEGGAPWILQFFVNDDLNISELTEEFATYVKAAHADPQRAQAILESRYTQAFIEEMASHLERISRPGGLFVDTKVTRQPWRGQRRRVRACIYRRFSTAATETAGAHQQLDQVAMTLMSTFKEAGVAARRGAGKDFYEWMVPFFNRKVPWAKTPQELLRLAPYPGDRSPTSSQDGSAEDLAPIFGWDFAEHLNFSRPVADLQGGHFEFDGVPVKALTLQNMKNQPDIGHFTAERKLADDVFARFDRMPEGSMLSTTIVIERQERMQRHIETIRDNSRAQTAVAQETHYECQQVLRRMAQGDKLYPMMTVLYLTGKNLEELNASISAVNAQLNPSGLKFIDARNDLVPLDSFVRGLPMCFDYAFDVQYLRRTRLTFASHVAALLPLYGRARGTGRPGFWFWNRGGEPLMADPLSKLDRMKNAHMLVLGPTGAGKSATLNYLCMLVMAIYRPRLVIADAGKSFALLIEYFKEMGLSTHMVQLNQDADVSLPPFVHALKLLDDRDVMESYWAMEKSAKGHASAVEGEGGESFERLAPELDDEDPQPAETPPVGGLSAEGDSQAEEEEADPTDKRDLLGEMLISATMMITGGEEKEVERFTRADRYMVSVAIIRAALLARKEGRDQAVVHDVAIQLMHMARDPHLSAARQARAEEMGQSMMTFTQALRGKLFNRPGQDWPDVDVIVVEMGTLTMDGYGDALAVAYTSLIDGVQARGERFQADDRPLIFLTDEGHLISTNELLGPKIAKGTKMWRKLNIWFWLATQNMLDFPDSMSRVLSMCEWWMLLTMDKSEIEQVARFRSLTPEQRQLIESATKEPPKYTEGVLISAIGQFLFRNVPPALPIALAMTEGHEKAARKRLMVEHGCTEVEAAKLIAKQLSVRRA